MIINIHFLIVVSLFSCFLSEPLGFKIYPILFFLFILNFFPTVFEKKIHLCESLLLLLIITSLISLITHEYYDYYYIFKYFLNLIFLLTASIYLLSLRAKQKIISNVKTFSLFVLYVILLLFFIYYFYENDINGLSLADIYRNRYVYAYNATAKVFFLPIQKNTVAAVSLLLFFIIHRIYSIKNNRFNYLFLILFFIFQFLLGSMTAFISLFVFYILKFDFLFKQKLYDLFIIVMIIFYLILFILATNISELQAQNFDFFNYGMVLGGGFERILMFHKVIQNITFFGNGVHSFSLFHNEFSTPFLHNIFIQQLHEFGLIGLCFSFFYIYFAFKRLSLRYSLPALIIFSTQFSISEIWLIMYILIMFIINSSSIRSFNG